MLDLIALGALIKAKRGQAKITQETLALDVFGDSTRKGDISRIENAKTTPQEATLQKLCVALNISDAEMLPIRTGGASAKQLDQIPTLSRDQLELLAARFEIEKAHDKGDDELRHLLNDKAEEYRNLRHQIAALDDAHSEIAEIKAAAEQAASDLDFEKVETLLEVADVADTAISAQTKMTRATNMLMLGRIEKAYDILSAVADSFRSVDPKLPAQFRLELEDQLYQHGLRYGSDGMAYSERMIRDALSQLDETTQPVLWASAQNSLAIALKDQGTRTSGAEGAALLAQSVTAYQSALRIHTEAEHPVQWAATQNNLANALFEQGTRTSGAEGAALLAQSVTAYQSALRIHTEAEHPVDWAMTQNNLANALSEQGTRTSGAEGAALLAESVTAYQSALRIYTEAEHPVQWAMIQENMAIVELEIAQYDTTTDPRAHLVAARAHIERALTVFDPTHMPYDHDTATELREHIRAALKVPGDS
ncbi:hypothetical protein [Planktotalea sp.]|uniref:helix-turn-helix domain-containing protein n=1 Tax=Planktotalea sp. TaxID=2029877 RepID=UPI003D6A5A43